MGVAGEGESTGLVEGEVDFALVVGVDGAGKGRVVLKIQDEAGDGIDDDVAGGFLVCEVHGDGAAVAAGIAPRIFLDAEEIAGAVVVNDLVVFEIDFGGGVGDVETVALVGGDGGILGGKHSLAAGGVARHGLVEEDVFVGGGLTIENIIGVG